MTPKVAVVIAVQNGETFLAEAIEGVLAQTRTDWSLIVIDDGSTDGTVAIARTYCERDTRVRVVQQSKSGVSVARNRGLSECDPDSPYVIFLDGDDVWEPDALEVLVDTLEAAPGYVAAHGHTHAIDAHSQLVAPDPWERWKSRMGISGDQVIDWPLNEPTTFAVLILELCIRTGGSVLIRRRVLDVVGHFDVGLTGFEDWHLWLRLASQGPIAFVSRSVLAYRLHATNASSDYAMMGRMRAQVRWKILSFPGLKHRAAPNGSSRAASYLRRRHRRLLATGEGRGGESTSPVRRGGPSSLLAVPHETVRLTSQAPVHVPGDAMMTSIPPHRNRR